MIERHQLFLHEPHNEIFGDCHRTVFACLLDLEPWRVPHFVQDYYCGKIKSVDAAVDEWLGGHGLFQTHVHFAANENESPENFFRYMDMWNPDLLWVMGGVSPRGTNHSVICQGGGFRWDPHPVGGFLVKPYQEDDFHLYQATILAPTSMRAAP